MAKKQQSTARFLGAETYPGNRIRLPPGSVAKGRDDGGRLLYQNQARNEWYAVVQVPGGWTVFRYAGSCNC